MSQSDNKVTTAQQASVQLLALLQSRHQTSSTRHNDINVVPLIDVLLVLLVALLVALPTLTQQLSVTLPKTRDGVRTETPQPSVRAIIAADASVRWPDGKDFSNPDRPLVIEADAAVAYDAVAKVLAEASAAGMHSIELLTRR